MSAINDSAFHALESAATRLVQQHCFAANISTADLSARAGIEVGGVNQVLDPSSAPASPDLNGKHWERIMSAVGISPEDWITLAQVTGVSLLAEEPRYGAASGDAPSGDADERIKRVLSITNEFYKAASQKWIERHDNLQPRG